MIVTIKDRLLIQGILIPLMPTKGRYVEMLQIKDLIEKTAITFSEIEKYNFRDSTGGNIIWDVLPDQEIILSLTDEQIDFLQLAVFALDETKSVDNELLPICHKIMQLT